MEGQQALVVDIINKLNLTANSKQKVGWDAARSLFGLLLLLFCSLGRAAVWFLAHMVSPVGVQVQHIEQLEELLLRSQPLLLDGFLPELIPLQVTTQSQRTVDPTKPSIRLRMCSHKHLYVICICVMLYGLDRQERVQQQHGASDSLVACCDPHHQ